MDGAYGVDAVTPEPGITTFPSSSSGIANKLESLTASVLASLTSLTGSSSDTPLWNTISTQDAQRDRDNDRTGLNPNGAVFKKLLAGILYSRFLCFVYYGVVGTILLALVLAHWGPRVKTWFKSRKTASPTHYLQRNYAYIDLWRIVSLKTPFVRHVAVIERECDGNDSSGDASPVQQNHPAEVTQVLETTPLLTANCEQEHGDKRSFLEKLYDSTRSWFCYQPLPLPGFRNRVMPSNLTTVTMLMYLGINVFFLLFGQDFKVVNLFIFADRASQLFVTNLPILYLLSAKNQPLQPLIGYSYASLNLVHRRLGEWMCFLAAFHGLGMISMWATLLLPMGYSWQRFFGDSVVLFGLGALTCYMGICFTSLATVRQAIYEFFLVSHIALQLGALSFLWLHHTKSHLYIGLSVGIWVLDRFVYRLLAKTGTYKAHLALLAGGMTSGVSVTVPLQKPSWLRKLFGMNNLRNGWETLDHVFLTVPGLSYKHVLQSHPFSIASVSPFPDNRNGQLELIVRSRTGFTNDLLTLANDAHTVDVRIEGPYGAHTASRLLENSDARVIVAGGSGIAVAYPLLEKVQQGAWVHRDAESATPIKPILFIWVVQSCREWEWINKERLRALERIPGIQIFFAPPTRQAGRPDLSLMVRDWIEVVNRNRLVQDEMNFGVVVSGPDGMGRELRNECANMQAKGLKVQIEIEKYGW